MRNTVASSTGSTAAPTAAPAAPAAVQQLLLLTCSSASSFSLALWNSSSGFCTQMADSSTKWLVPCSRATSSTFLVAW